MNNSLSIEIALAEANWNQNLDPAIQANQQDRAGDQDNDQDNDGDQDDDETSLADLMDEGNAQIRAGNFESAAAMFQKAIDINDSHGQAWQLLGYSLHMKGDLDAAIEAHLKAAAFEEYRPIALYNLGCAYSLKEDADTALLYLDRAVEAGFNDLGFLNDDTDLDNIREDQRFKDLVARIKNGGKPSFDLGSLAGRWQVLSGESAGEETTAATRPSMIVMTEQTITLALPDPIEKTLEMSYEVDSSTTPLKIDMTFGEEMFPDAQIKGMLPGILKIDDGQMWLCCDPAGEQRPEQFATTPEDGFHLFVCKLNPTDCTRIAFGSCADMDETTQPTWHSIVDQAPEALVLLGDTPYIDSTDPEVQRERYEQFAAGSGFIAVREAMTIYGIWDDHDFGRNDTDGNLPGKENSRQAFIDQYEPLGNETFGNGSEGVYTTFRQGEIQVFLLDTRYFAATGPSPFDADRLTLLGDDQWEWLRKELSASDASFKVLACGMIWNGSVRPGKLDHWATYPHEYDALMQFVGDEQISGVVLIGGDIHRSRCVLHETEAAAGYAVPEFITSPMHDRIIDTANQPHPGLQFDAGAPHSFLVLDAEVDDDGLPTLTARYLAIKETAENSESHAAGEGDENSENNKDPGNRDLDNDESSNNQNNVYEIYTFTRTLGELSSDR